MNGGILLEARGISKSFPGVRALQGVDLEVRAGEVHALLGENGAGKSTLMHILAGVFQPDEGAILLEGREVRIENERRAQELGIAMVFQEGSLAPALSVAENVFFARQPANRLGVIDRGALEAGTRRILDRLGLEIDPRTILERLSPAQQQMVEIAKALSLDARLLILDEPTSALTEAETAALFETIRRLQDKGAGIIYISHRLAEIFRIADRVTVLKDGICQGTRDIRQVTPDALISLMVGRDFAVPPREEGVAAQGPPALEVRGLTDHTLVRDMSFSARAGEILALAGLAGAGRTELALAIFGAAPRKSGEILLGGKPVRIRSPRDAIRHGIGYLPENRKEAGLFLEMSIAWNVAAGRLEKFGSWWLDEGALRDAAGESCRKLRLPAGRADRLVRELSGGSQQKVVLAKWFLLEPRVLIADEPTRGVDVGAKAEVHAILRELARQGTAVVLISSELPEVLAVADRILVLREGRIAGELGHGEATEEKILRLASIPEGEHVGS